MAKRSPAEYAKAWVGWGGAVLTAIILGLPAVGVQVPVWLAVVTLVATAIGVQEIPNRISEDTKAGIIADAVLDPASPVQLADVPLSGTEAGPRHAA